MTKKELIWREILFQAIEKKKWEFTQKELAEKFGFSLSTVFNALKVSRETGAIKVTGRNFSVIDAEKFLYIWATQRSLEKEIIYQTYVPENVSGIEGKMPAEIIFGGPSAYVLRYKDAPADYAKVYVYAKETGLEEKDFLLVPFGTIRGGIDNGVVVSYVANIYIKNIKFLANINLNFFIKLAKYLG